MVVSGVVVWGASLRVEGVGAEGLALQFLGFALLLLLLLLLLDPWGPGLLVPGRCPLSSIQEGLCGGSPLLGSSSYASGFGCLVSSFVLVVLFLVLFLFLYWGKSFSVEGVGFKV